MARGDSKDREYFGVLPEFSEDFAAAVIKRFKAHESSLRTSHRHDRMRRSWLKYYSRSEDGGWDETRMRAGGKQGELTFIKPNHYRNLIQHQVTMITQAPPSYQTVAINSDSESLAQAQLGNGVLDYYCKTYGVEEQRVSRAETALLLGESFAVAPWEESAGKAVSVKDEVDDAGNAIQSKVYEGDLQFSVRTPYEVAYDHRSRDRNRPAWVIVYEPVLKYDLAALFPEHRDEILDLPSWSSWMGDWGYDTDDDEDNHDYCGRYRIYFERSPALPDGRHAIVVSDKLVLLDRPLVDDRASVFRLACSDVIMGKGAYTNNFDVLQMSECYGNQMSTILSNHATFGGQIIAAPKGSQVKPWQLGRNLTVLEYMPMQGTQPPMAIDLMSAQQQHLTFLDVLKRDMETLAAVNAVKRGDVAAAKGDSGAKDALLHATAEQFASGFAGALRRSDEAMLTHVLMTLKQRANTPRVATIAGKYQTYAAREWQGSDLKAISRVVVRAADPMRDTYEGRSMLADKLITLPSGIVTAEHYVTFLATGRLEPMYEGEQAELNLIRRENEELRDPKAKELPIVSPGDQHLLHYREHNCLLADPEIRRDPARWQRIRAHNELHLRKLSPLDPEFAGNEVLAATRQTPFPVPGVVTPPGDEAAAAEGAPPIEAPPEPAEGAPEQPSNGRPGMPKMPINPATGQRAPGAVPPPPATAMG